MNDIAFTSAATLAELISTKKISPVEITELYLRRIEQLDPQLNSYLTVIGAAALDNAKSCEASVMNGEHLGPLHGVPISVLPVAQQYSKIGFPQRTLLWSKDSSGQGAYCLEKQPHLNSGYLGTLKTFWVIIAAIHGTQTGHLEVRLVVLHLLLLLVFVLWQLVVTAVDQFEFHQVFVVCTG